MNCFTSNLITVLKDVRARITPGMRTFAKRGSLELPGYAPKPSAKEIHVQWWNRGRCTRDEIFTNN